MDGATPGVLQAPLPTPARERRRDAPASANESYPDQGVLQLVAQPLREPPLTVVRRTFS